MTIAKDVRSNGRVVIKRPNADSHGYGGQDCRPVVNFFLIK
jgi:hypothetical protein